MYQLILLAYNKGNLQVGCVVWPHIRIMNRGPPEPHCIYYFNWSSSYCITIRRHQKIDQIVYGKIQTDIGESYVYG